MSKHPTEQSFLKDVAQHQMIVLRDDGLSRHIRFMRPNTSCQHFDLITWPGKLCYTGDMGTYVFQRLDDMFEFFRTDRDYGRRNGRQVYINPGYWAEKLIAVDSSGRHGGSAEQFDSERFTEIVKRQLIEWMRDRDRCQGAEMRHELREQVESGVLSYADHGESAAMQAAMDFEHKGFQFVDFWEHRLKDWTYHFIWCCYAIAWGVEQYDEAKEAVPA